MHFLKCKDANESQGFLLRFLKPFDITMWLFLDVNSSDPSYQKNPSVLSIAVKSHNAAH